MPVRLAAFKRVVVKLYVFDRTSDIAWGENPAYICVRDMGDGGLLEKLLFEFPWPACPLDVTFDLEDRFYSHRATYRKPHILATPSKSGTRPPDHRGGKLPPVLRPWRRHLSMDDSGEWVASGSRRICWIPTEYIGFQSSYCWAESTFVMAGQDGISRIEVYLTRAAVMKGGRYRSSL